MDKILVTGGAGYIGSILVRLLLNSGYVVKILDNFSFGLNPIKDIISNAKLDIFIGDITNVEDLGRAIKDVDTVVHLAAIVGDPACNVCDADTVFETNFVAPVRLAALAREHNVKKFIFASTCSVYGANDARILNETSTSSPISIYSRTKFEAEKQILLLKTDDFSPYVLRLATLYGMSSRMRFDLAINYITMKAVTERKVIIFGGNQWRPFIHVTDVAGIFQTALEAPVGKVSGEIFNIGSTDENYQMKKIGELIKKLISDVEVTYATEIEDKRSYNVSFDKVARILRFNTTKRIEDGIFEIKDAIEKGVIRNPNDPIYYNHQISKR